MTVGIQECFYLHPPKKKKKIKVLNIYEASTKFKAAWLSLLYIFLETVKFGRKEFLLQ